MNTQKQLIKAILENAAAFKWSLQGLGMLRMYLSVEVRLHIWDSRYAIPNVSTIHDHPWAFKSEVIAGSIKQYRLVEDNRYAPPDSLYGPPPGLMMPQPYLFAVLQCGPGGCAKTQPTPINLRRESMEWYDEGRSYEQRHDEIHESVPADGTVTIVTRTFREDTEHARVFWPAGTEWVSAEPRPATLDEVKDITSAALARWFTIQDEKALYLAR